MNTKERIAAYKEKNKWATTAQAIEFASPYSRYRQTENQGTWQTAPGALQGAYLSMRFVGEAKDAGETGYYCDSFYDNAAVPVVVKLPHGRYYPGVRFTDQDGVTSWPNDISDTAEECARYAHHYAERLAESAREDDAKQSAEVQIELAQDTIAQSRKRILSAIAEIRTANLPPTICDMARQSIHSLRSDMHKARKRIEKLEDNYWHAVEG